MSNDDETVERVARAICVTAGNRPDALFGDGTPVWGAYVTHARAAISAMPLRELLREALDALAYVIENRSCNHRIAENQAAVDFYAKACATCRARAAADKIRAGVKEGNV